MQALRLTRKLMKLEVTQVPIPKICNPDQILIKVAYAGVCGTDLHILSGKFDSTEEVTMGHEFCGTICEVGPKVRNLKNGDKVVIDPNAACHACNYCQIGSPHFCPVEGVNSALGIWQDGGFAEYCVVKAEVTHKLPDSVTLEQGRGANITRALIEPLSCIIHGYELLGPVAIGKKILIIGAGIVGNLWSIVLHLKGHRSVTVVEKNPIRLKGLEKLETGYCLMTPEDLKKDQLYDLIIECSGAPQAIECAFTLLDKGGILCVYGVASEEAEVKINPFQIFAKELKILGARINPYTFPKAISVAGVMGDRYLKYEKLGIKEFCLKDHKQAMEMLQKGDITKVMFKPT